jgi:hypothetical protein
VHSKSESKLHYYWQTDRQIVKSVSPLWPATPFGTHAHILICRQTRTVLVVMGRPVWREEVLSVCRWVITVHTNLVTIFTIYHKCIYTAYKVFYKSLWRNTAMYIKLVKKFPSSYGTWMFITVYTTARHWSLFWARCIQPTPSQFLSQPPF